MTISRLPKEILLTTFSYLDIRDLMYCSQVCKQWSQLVLNDNLWKSIAAKLGLRIEKTGTRERIYTFFSGINKRINTLSKQLNRIFSLNVLFPIEEFKKIMVPDYPTIESVQASQKYLDACNTLIVWKKMAEAINQNGPELENFISVEAKLNKAKEFSAWCKEHQTQLGSISSLDLSECRLIRLPREIGLLVNLTELYLENNQISEIPKELGLLVNLTKLYLDSNQISEIPKELGLLVNLTELYLDYNQISEIPKELGLLVNLTKLYLDYNQISEIPKELGLLVNLAELYLDHNQISEIPQEIEKLPKLVLFNFNDNKIVNKNDPSEIPRLKQFEQVLNNVKETMEKSAKEIFHPMDTSEGPGSEKSVPSKRKFSNISEDQEQLEPKDLMNTETSKKHKNNEEMESSDANNLVKTVYDAYTTGDSALAVKKLTSQINKEKDLEKKYCLLHSIAFIFNSKNDYKSALSTAFIGLGIGNKPELTSSHDSNDVFSREGLQKEYNAALSQLKPYEIALEHAKVYNQFKKYERALSELDKAESSLISEELDTYLQACHTAIPKFEGAKSSLKSADAVNITNIQLQIQDFEQEQENRRLYFQTQKTQISAERTKALNGK